MGIRFRCHHCQKKLNIKTELAGRRGICPGCSGRFRIPLQDQEYSGDLSNSESGLSTPNAETRGEEGNRMRHLPREHQQKFAVTTESRSDVMYLVRPPSGGIYGPANLKTIESWIDQQRITSDTKLSPVGTNQWTPAEDFFPTAFLK